MAIIGVNIEATTEYTCKSDTDNPTKWVLGTLSSRVLGILKDQSASFAASGEDSENLRAEFKVNKSAHDAVQFGLRGWGNFCTQDGSQISYQSVEMSVPGTSIKVPAVPTALMEMIPLEVIRELSEELDKQNTTGDEEGKDSGA